MDKKFSLKKNWLYLVLLLGVILVVFWLLFYDEAPSPPADQVFEDDMLEIEVVELDSGEKLVKNVEEGYEFVVGEKREVSVASNLITILEQDKLSDELYLGVSIQIEEVKEKSIEDYLKTNTSGFGLNDPGVVKNEDYLKILNYDVEVASFDFTNSHWPSEGGLTKLYLFSLDSESEEYILLSHSSASHQLIEETKKEVYEIIEKIIKSKSS